jgi:serine/threonine protein phosphatase PrpC
MARRPLLLCAVTIASAAVWSAAPHAAAQPRGQVVIGFVDDRTACGPAALEAVTAALQDVENLDAARRDVRIAVTSPDTVELQQAADGFTLVPYTSLTNASPARAWLLQRGAYDCPERTPALESSAWAFRQNAAAGNWRLEEVTSAERLQFLAWDRFGKPPGGRNLLVPILLLVALAAVAAIVVALVVRARRPAVTGRTPAPPPPPPPPSQQPLAPPPPQSLGVTRQQAPGRPAGQAGQKVAPRKGRSSAAQPVALRPLTTLEGVVGSKRRSDLGFVEPARRGSAAVWPIARSGLQVTAVYTEKVAELGEDAEPSVVLVPERRAILLGVYDGLGGAGSAAVETSGGLTYNEAFVASRVTREEVESWFLDGGSSQLLDVGDLRTRLAERLTEVAAAHLPARSSGVRSNLARTLPTTVAAAVLRDAGGELAIEAVWAGDSRVFLLSPQSGLQQLTADHVRDSDVLHQLVNDSPMSNMVSASNRFEIATSRLVHTGPGVVVCATDGVFGYVHTPGEVECVLLDSLEAASDPASWGDRLVDRITTYTGDDATLAVAAVGFKDFASLRSAFATRAADVDAEQHLPFAGVDAADHDAVVNVRAETWSRYQAGYTALMPGGEHTKERTR